MAAELLQEPTKSQYQQKGRNKESDHILLSHAAQTDIRLAIVFQTYRAGNIKRVQFNY